MEFNFNLKIANILNEVSRLNPFENSRKREIIEIRSVLIKILRDYQGLTLYEIADFFRSNNKAMDHSTVIYSLKNYEVYTSYNSKLIGWYDFIVHALFQSGDFEKSFIAKRKVLKNRIDCLNKKNLDELLMYSEALASEQINKINTLYI